MFADSPSISQQSSRSSCELRNGEQSMRAFFVFFAKLSFISFSGKKLKEQRPHGNYDPAIARFTQADSLIDASTTEGMNQYMYVNGNPINFTDPSGHKPKAPVVWAAAGFLIAQSQGKSFEESVKYAAVGYGIGYHKQQDEKKRNSVWGKYHRSDAGQFSGIRTEKFFGKLLGAKAEKWGTKFGQWWKTNILGKNDYEKHGGELYSNIFLWATYGFCDLSFPKETCALIRAAAFIGEYRVKEKYGRFPDPFNGGLNLKPGKDEAKGNCGVAKQQPGQMMFLIRANDSPASPGNDPQNQGYAEIVKFAFILAYTCQASQDDHRNPWE
jgi:RHS repeat-associated protein